MSDFAGIYCSFGYSPRFSPSLKIQTYVGDKDKRHELASNIKRDLKKGREPFDILLTTYEVNNLFIF